MPVMALVRNLGRFSALGMTETFGMTLDFIVKKLNDREAILKSKIHPINFLLAIVNYRKGSNRNMTWSVSTKILDALNDAYELAFANVTPSNKNILICLDVSGSMGWSSCMGFDGITPREASAALALITYKSEPNVEVIAFGNTLVKFEIRKNDTVETICQRMSGLPFGGTDLSLPIDLAIAKNAPIDAFVYYTDSEVNTGAHAMQRLNMFRSKSGRDAKMVVCAMQLNEFSIGDDSTKCLQVAGFDANVPSVISNFIGA
jgi:60 kDa SS-A/Ro ribonucleoprotein